MTREYIKRTAPSVDMPVTGSTQDATNPANSLEQRQEKFSEKRKRVSMNTARRRLETPELPGYYLHWVSGEPDRIAKAIRAEYTFVQKDELPGYTLELGDQTGITGSADMGSSISVLAGGSANDGQALRLYLMKLPAELREEDMKQRDEEGQQVIDTLYTNPSARAVSGQDNERRYSEFDMKTETRGHRENKPKSQSFNAFDNFRKR